MSSDDQPVKSLRTENGVTVATLQGEIDLHQTPALHRALIQALSSEPPKLVVNMADVGYLDSSGIGTLVEIFRRMNRYGGKMALCCLNDRVHSVFEITKLDKFFSIYDSQEEALEA